MAKTPRTPKPQKIRSTTLVRDDRAAFLAQEDQTDAVELTPDQRESARKAELVKQALQCFQTCAEAEHAQRLREQEDLRFDRALPEDQWPQEILEARRGGATGPAGRMTAARPCLTIPKLDQPVQQVLNEARATRVSPKFRPKGAGANAKGAEVRQGIYRTIEVDSNASSVRQWALDRAVKCGRGFYRILKEFANDGDFDQDITIAEIENQGSVYFDPFAQKPDKSDAEWCLITTDLPEDEYHRRFPGFPVGHSAVELTTTGDDLWKGWIGEGPPDGQRIIRVAEYFYVVHDYVYKVLDTTTGETMEMPELPEGYEAREGVKVRRIDKRRVEWAIVNAKDVLQEERWDGRYIPVVPVIGKRYVVDGDKCWKGVISNAKDAQRSYNVMRSALIESIGLAPRAPFVMAEGQDEGYKDMWDLANVRNWTRLIYRPKTFEGQLVPPPQRNVVEPAIQAIVVAVQEADMDIQATTGRFNPSLGRGSDNQSGKAINALKTQGEMGTSNYVDDLAQISITHEARIILDLMPKVYDTPGRIMRTLGEDYQTEEQIMINEPFVRGPDQTPIPVSQVPPRPGIIGRAKAMIGMGGPSPAVQEQAAEQEHYDLTKGSYNVVVSIGRSFATQREENAAVIQGILEAAPQLAPMIAPDWLEQMDNPAAKRIAEKLRKLAPQPDEKDQQVPPQVQQQLQALGQQNQQLTQALQKLTQEVQTDAVKENAETERTKLKIEAEERIKLLELRAKVMEVQTRTESAEGIALLKAESERLLQAAEFTHDARMARAKAVMEAGHKGADRDDARAARQDAAARASERPAV